MTAARQTAEDLRRQISVLRETVAAAERKRRGIDDAITSRRKTLQRIEAQLAVIECGPAHVQDE
jgi:hypothetical protein